MLEYVSNPIKLAMGSNDQTRSVQVPKLPEQHDYWDIGSVLGWLENRPPERNKNH